MPDRHTRHDHDRPPSSSRVPIGAGLGMIFGSALGAIGVGLVLGAAVGVALDARGRGKSRRR